MAREKELVIIATNPKGKKVKRSKIEKKLKKIGLKVVDVMDIMNVIPRETEAVEAPADAPSIQAPNVREV